MRNEKLEDFEIIVSACNGEVTSNGYNSTNKGMIHFNYGYSSMSLRGDSKFLAKDVASDLENSLRKNSGVKIIKFNFLKIRTNVPIIMDGYFGRPVVHVGATFLKPLPNKKKITLAREINKISKITDKWGNEIKLIV